MKRVDENTEIEFMLAVHVKPGATARVTVTVDPNGTDITQQVHDLVPTFDWPLDATVDQAHMIPVKLLVVNFNYVTIAAEDNDILVLGYLPQGPGTWRFAGVPEWDSGQMYSDPENFDAAPHALPIQAGDRVSFYCRVLPHLW